MRGNGERLISRPRLLLLALLSGAATIAVACGLSTTGTGENVGDRPDTSTPVDATIGDEITFDSDGGIIVTDGSTFDATTADATEDADASLPTFLCDDAGVTSCSTCAGRPSACGATGACVGECASDCPGFRVACFRCLAGGAVVQGTCEAENDAGYCMNGSYAPGAACPCFVKDASTCPGDFQMCIDAGSGYACHSCGEQGTNGVVCKSGTGQAKCDLGGNATDHLTCH